MINKLWKILKEEIKKCNHDNSWLDCLSWVVSQINEVKKDSSHIAQLMDHFFNTGTGNMFQFIQSGTSYGSTKKREARISITMPRTICDKNLQDLKKWRMFVFAFPIKEYDRFIKEDLK